MQTAATVPAGTANRSTRPTKPGLARWALGANARKNAGMPMVRLLTIVRCRGRNGNGTRATPTMRHSSAAYTVLVRNRLATRSTLAMTRRPSPNTGGRLPKSESSSTTGATARLTGAPDPMATPRSASLRASTSLTPSPVMATVCPRACNARTIACFCCGPTRPKTPVVSIMSASSSGSSGSSRASRADSALAIPTRAATAPTVRGSSPDTTLTVTSCEAK